MHRSGIDTCVGFRARMCWNCRLFNECSALRSLLRLERLSTWLMSSSGSLTSSGIALQLRRYLLHLDSDATFQCEGSKSQESTRFDRLAKPPLESMYDRIQCCGPIQGLLHAYGVQHPSSYAIVGRSRITEASRL